jgi:membrane-associated phospholipid phosphatase
MGSKAHLHPPPAPVAGVEEAVQTAEQALSEARVPSPQQVARGRRFLRLYLSVLVVAGLLFVSLGLLAHSTTTLLRFDVPIERAVQSVHIPLYSWVLTQESDFGFAPLNIVSYVVVFVLLLAAGLRSEAVLAIVSSVLADLVGGLIKQAVGRLRPSAAAVHVVGHVTGYSYPSGHVVQYTTLFGFSFYLVLVAWRAGWLRTLVLTVLALLILLVGPSRVYLGQHWPSDVLGAYLFAGVWLSGTIELHLFLKRHIEWWSPPRHPGPRRRASWHGH